MMAYAISGKRRITTFSSQSRRAPGKILLSQRPVSANPISSIEPANSNDHRGPKPLESVDRAILPLENPSIRLLSLGGGGNAVECEKLAWRLLLAGTKRR